jgi:hypothetical protein
MIDHIACEPYKILNRSSNNNKRNDFIVMKIINLR